MPMMNTNQTARKDGMQTTHTTKLTRRDVFDRQDVGRAAADKLHALAG